MKKFNEILQKYVYPTCTFFSLFILIWSIIINSSGSGTKTPTVTILFCVLFFALSMSFINRIFFVKSMSLSGKVTAHFFTSLFSFVVFIVFFTDWYRQNGSSSLILIVVFAVVYWLIAAPILITKSVVSRENNKKSEYKSMVSSSHSAKKKK